MVHFAHICAYGVETHRWVYFEDFDMLMKKKLILIQKCKKIHSNHIFLCSQYIDKHCGIVLLPSNKLQQPDNNMNIISSLNFVQLNCFIDSKNDDVVEMKRSLQETLRQTKPEQWMKKSETESSWLQPRTTRIRHNYYYYYYYYN